MASLGISRSATFSQKNRLFIITLLASLVNGSYYNGYYRVYKGCVHGNNIVKYTSKSVDDCIRLCNSRNDCLGFEYGVNYGGSGTYRARDCQLQRSANWKGCDGGHHNLDFYIRCKSCNSGYYGQCMLRQEPVCRSCSSCPTGQWISTRCSSDQNTRCSQCRSCGSGYYISRGCSKYQNTDCSRCSSCSTGYYISTRCSSNQNTLCTACRSCATGYYISTPCSTYQNTVCTRCRSCAVGWYISTPCSTHQNTVCSTESPTHQPTLSPTNTPTAPPTSNPTLSPTKPCIDIYEFCSISAYYGFCNHHDHGLRRETQMTCALSCGTCFNGTMSPSHQPSLLPTRVPTSPTSAPTQLPSTRTPTVSPTVKPSTNSPTQSPSTIAPTQKSPTIMPTEKPSTNSPTQTPSRNPTQKPSETPTKIPTNTPSGSPTCFDFIGYCGVLISFCDSAHVETQAKMSKDCASTCGFCSLSPTNAPSVPCVDLYGYCEEGALAGACHNKNKKARMDFISHCPVSCGTCYSGTVFPTSRPTDFPTHFPTNVPSNIPTISPSILPTFLPTAVPTNAPTCVDLIKYCEFVKSSCNSSDTITRTKLHSDCAYTCGHCTEQPTQFPSTPCVDTYGYCADVAKAGGCYQSDHKARLHFQDDCPMSCGTCHSQTVTPTFKPSYSPTVSPPTVSPTCEDVSGYCELLRANGYCNSSSLLNKMKADCTYTCGYCTLYQEPDDL
jgi:hypothetical protein